jgi:uncharacterized membrane protein
MTETRHATHPPRPLHPYFIAPGAALLMAAFVTDLIYCRTFAVEWETFSAWLLTGGLILAALAGLALLLDALVGRIGSIAWLPFAGLTIAALLSLLNAFVHSRDGYTAVVPEGVVLSGVVTVLLLAAGWRGWNLSAVQRLNLSQPTQVRP